MREVEIEKDGLVAELLCGLTESPFALGIGEDLSPMGNENAAAGAAFQDAVADEILIGAGDGVGVDDEGFREDADGRELFTDVKAARGDRLLHLVNDLTENGNIAGWSDREC